MRKERAVGLCICLILLGNLQAQRIAGWPPFALHSLPEAFWAAASGGQPGTIGSKLEVNVLGVSGWDPSRIPAIFRIGWTPLDIIYSELQLMRINKVSPSHQFLRHMSCRDWTRILQSHSSELLRHSAGGKLL